MHAQAHGLRARFEHRNDAFAPYASPQTVERGGDCGRMMRKVVVDLDPRRLATQLHAPGDAAEAPQRLDAALDRYPGVAGSRERRQRIVDVMRADQVPLQLTAVAALVQHLEAREVALRGRLRPPLHAGAAAGREFFHAAPATRGQYLRQMRIGTVADDAAAARHGAQQVLELPLDGRQIGVNVGVIVFEIVQHQGARPVVHEFRALVEERGIVLIGFDDEERLLAEPRAKAEILRQAADQKSRRQSRVLEDPGEHAAGRGLAVSAGHPQYPALAQYRIGQPLRPRGIRQVAIEHGLDHRHAARHDVADDDDLGLELELFGVVALDQFDAERAQLRAQRRIHIAVRTGDAVSGRARDRGDAAHERAANSENMNVHTYQILDRWTQAVIVG